MKPAYRFLALLLFICCASFFTSCDPEHPEPLPEISGLNPTHALPGDHVTITGRNFPTHLSLVSVKIGHLNASVRKTATDAIQFTVPAGAVTGKVEVVIEGKSYFSLTDLIIDLPAVLIHSFTPGSGETGTVVTIVGENFDTDRAKNSVKFNGVTATVLEASGTQLKVTVPSGATTGKVSVSVNNQTGVSSTDFVIAAPAIINSFSPDKGPKGTLVTVTGSHFQSTAQVFVNGMQVPAADVTISPSSIQLKVPPAATEGKISIKQNDTEFFSNANFKVTDVWRLISSTPFPHEVHFGVSFTDGSKLYVGLGSDAPVNGNLQSDFFSYDFGLKTWIRETALSGGVIANRNYAAATFVDNKLYLGTGINATGTALKDWNEFDFSSRTWTVKLSMSTTSYGNVAFSIGSSSYLALGNNNLVYEYNHPTASWNSITHTLPVAQAGYAFVIDNTGYFGGGENNSTAKTAFYELKQTPSGSIINPSAPLPAGAAYFAGFALHGKGYVTYKNEKLYQYHPATNTWISKAVPPEALLYAQVVGDRAYAITATGKVYEYVPES